MITSWSIPEKVEDLYPKKALHLENYRRRLLDYFIKNKFDLLDPSMIEYSENVIFNGKSIDKQMFKVSDPLSGEVIGITPDLTIQTARIDNYLAKKASEIKRYCYCGPVLKSNSAQFNQSREELQMGVEIYGNDNISADIDVINTLIRSFKLLKIKDILISFNDISIYKELIISLGLESFDSPLVRTYFAKKDLVSIKNNFGKNLTQQKLITIENFLDAYGDANVLKKLSSLFSKNPQIISKIKKLKKIADALSSQVQINFDLSDVDCYEYHSDLIFTAYSKSYNFPLAKGGRFENLTSNFGKKRPAVGFTFDLRKLLFAGLQK